MALSPSELKNKIGRLKYVIQSDKFPNQSVPLRKIVDSEYDAIAHFGQGRTWPVSFIIMALTMDGKYEQRVLLAEPDAILLSNPDILGAVMVEEDWDQKRICDELAEDIRSRREAKNAKGI